MGFDDVLGHDKVCERLRNAILGGRVHHAYLLIGIQGVGRRTVARVFARALNCVRADGDACEQCVSCKKIRAGVHPDVRFLADDDSPTINIGLVREEVIPFVGLKVLEGRYRAVVIPDVERMTSSAANAMLKTLEEPPERTVFVLTTANANALLPTIRSRCQKIQLTPLAEDIIVKYLIEKVGMAFEQARGVARLAGGSLGKALGLKEEEVRLRADLLAAVVEAGCRGVAVPGSLVEELLTGREARRAAATSLEVLRSFFRDAAMVSAGTRVPLLNPDQAEGVEAVASNMAFRDIVRLVDLTVELDRAIRLNIPPQVVLERFFIALEQRWKVDHAR